MVADGKGNVDGAQDHVSILDLGDLGDRRLSRMLRGPWRALSAICKIKPALIHFHDPELIPLAILLKLGGYKIIFDVHEQVSQQTHSKGYIPKIIRYPVALALSVLESLIARFCDAIIPATPEIAKLFPAKKTVTVQNFPLAAELISAVPIPYLERPKLFVYVGVIASIRSAEEMIQALALLEDIHDIKLELAGMFSPASLEHHLVKLSGWNAAKYHGQITRTQMAHLLGTARAGMVLFHPLPNHMDAQPNKMFEYMSAGLPIIASDFALWRRIIDGVGCGLLVDPLNPKAIAEAMRWILDHPTEAEAMGNRGRQAVERFYNWNTEAIKLVSLYKRLLPP
jgi:glycosyltransferase involved in cell wall biosynthesis